jgi:hypothetical protein
VTADIFLNRVLRRIFENKRHEVMTGWSKIHHKELHNLYNSPNFTRVIKLSYMSRSEHVARVGEIRNMFIILVGRPRYRSEGNIRLDLRELGWEVVDWFHLTYDSNQYKCVLKAVMKLGVT